ncbi:hypothetical protein HZ326_28477 [Fusarium oxysporum f. sp. albedinis]|nr:hypothetical protein HZ326_28477 [Fusarium oxysporum f. sp. albedinis]
MQENYFGLRCYNAANLSYKLNSSFHFTSKVKTSSKSYTILLGLGCGFRKGTHMHTDISALSVRFSA